MKLGDKKHQLTLSQGNGVKREGCCFYKGVDFVAKFSSKIVDRNDNILGNTVILLQQNMWYKGCKTYSWCLFEICFWVITFGIFLLFFTMQKVFLIKCKEKMFLLMIYFPCGLYDCNTTRGSLARLLHLIICPMW